MIATEEVTGFAEVQRTKESRKMSCSGVMCQWVHRCILGLGHNRVQHHN